MSLKFSIIVPAYNVEQFITECIESVLAQTYTNFELILVDDGTPDKSGAICDEYASRDCRITVYHKINQGSLHSRRYGIERATGDYYVFLDSDDSLKKNALEEIKKAIEKYNCDTVIYGFERVYEGKVISQTYDAEEMCLKTKADIYRRLFFETDKNALWRKAVKSDVFKGVDYSAYYHIKMGEDLLQSLEIYKYSKSIAFISDILYEYRMNAQSITHTNKITKIDFTVRKKVLEFLRHEDVFSTEDFDRYKDYCIGLLIGIIYEIGRENWPINQKKALFGQIRKDDYFKDFLSNGITNRDSLGKKKYIYDLFLRKWDTLLIIALYTAGKIKGFHG